MFLWLVMSSTMYQTPSHCDYVKQRNFWYEKHKRNMNDNDAITDKRYTIRARKIFQKFWNDFILVRWRFPLFRNPRHNNVAYIAGHERRKCTMDRGEEKKVTKKLFFFFIFSHPRPNGGVKYLRPRKIKITRRRTLQCSLSAVLNVYCVRSCSFASRKSGSFATCTMYIIS